MLPNAAHRRRRRHDGLCQFPLAPSGPHAPRRRRPDARSFSGRRGRAHLARGAGSSRANRSRELRLGGAANVAHNASALGASVHVVGIVGHDDAGRSIRSHLEELGIDASGIVADAERRTTRKLRVVTSRNQQVARVDYEDDREADGAVEAAVVSRIEQLSSSVEAIVLSDYLKGSRPQVFFPSTR